MAQCKALTGSAVKGLKSVVFDGVARCQEFSFGGL